MMEKMNKHTMMQNWLLSIIKARIQSFVDLENYCQVPEKKKKKSIYTNDPVTWVERVNNTFTCW